MAATALRPSLFRK